MRALSRRDIPLASLWCVEDGNAGRRSRDAEGVQAPIRRTTYTGSLIRILAFRASTEHQRANPGRTRL
jgi:hypothetical protein